jgi:hypothetical protein
MTAVILTVDYDHRDSVKFRVIFDKSLGACLSVFEFLSFMVSKETQKCKNHVTS